MDSGLQKKINRFQIGFIRAIHIQMKKIKTKIDRANRKRFQELDRKPFKKLYKLEKNLRNLRKELKRRNNIISTLNNQLVIC